MKTLFKYKNIHIGMSHIKFKMTATSAVAGERINTGGKTQGV